MADATFDDVPPTTFSEVLRRNIRAARAARGLTQDSLAERMRELGFTAWLRQTVPNVENGGRRVTAIEVWGLAYSLETTIPTLMGTAQEEDDTLVRFPSGDPIKARSVRARAGGFKNDRALIWRGNKPVFGPARLGYWVGEAERSQESDPE